MSLRTLTERMSGRVSSSQSGQCVVSGCQLRTVGMLSPSALCSSLLSAASPFQLSASHRLTSLHTAAVTSLAVDGVEWRYLLSADSHGLVALYDTQPSLVRPSMDGSNRSDGSSGTDTTMDPSVAVPCSSSSWYVAHPLSSSSVSDSRGAGGGAGSMISSSINSVVWYPVDTGMFVSGGQDGGVNIWDTNTFSVEATFTMRDAAVNCVAMSPLAAASTHSLIAVGSTDINVRLCDVNSGGFAHTLIGHQAEVTSVCWTPFSEFILATASVDRTVRLWDIRRSGCLLLFDQFNTAVKDNATLSSTSTSLAARYTAAPTSSLSRRDVTSHSASVSHITFTPSSCLLLSLGTDSRLRVWDPFSGRHLLVHFPHLQCRYRYSRFDVQQMAGVGQLGERVWVGSGRDVRELPLSGGSGVRHVAHFDRVNVVAVNNRWDEVYSSGVDHSVLVWQKQIIADAAEQEDGELTKPVFLDGEQSVVTQLVAVRDVDDWTLEEGEEVQ